MTLSSELYILLFDSDLESDHLETILSSLRLWATVSARAHVQEVIVGNHTFLSGVLTVTSSVQISWKKFRVEKLISPAIKNRAEEISDILLSPEKGLREFSRKGGGSEPRNLLSFSMMCPQVVSVAVTSQSSLLSVCHSHQAGTLERESKSKPHDNLRMEPRLKYSHNQRSSDGKKIFHI